MVTERTQVSLWRYSKLEPNMPRTPIYDLPNYRSFVGNRVFNGLLTDGDWYDQVTRGSVDYWWQADPLDDGVVRAWDPALFGYHGRVAGGLVSIMEVNARIVQPPYELGDPERDVELGWDWYQPVEYNRVEYGLPYPGGSSEVDNDFRAIYPWAWGGADQFHFDYVDPLPGEVGSNYLYISYRVRIMGHRIPCSLRWNPDYFDSEFTAPTASLTSIVHFNNAVGWEQVVENPRPNNGYNTYRNMRLCPV